MSYEVDNLLSKLPPYQGRKKLIKRRQHTTDIIQGIMSLHPRMMDHYDGIAADHWRGNVEDTARELYSFAKRNLPYQEEKTMTQTVKTPAAILEERRDFGNDCKHYASYIVGVGEALRRQGKPVKCFYRFASYKPGERSPGHVFAVFVHNGKEIWVDPVPQIRSFDSRGIQPVMKVDKMPPMSKNGSRIGSLYEISGVPHEQSLGRALHGDQGLGHCHWLDAYGQPQRPQQRQPGQSRIYRWRGEHQQQGPDPHRAPQHDHWLDESMGKAKKKHKGLHLKIKAPHIKVQPGKLLKKLAGAPSRNAFALLIKLNTFHLATNMWKNAAHDKNSSGWKALSSKWRSLGGNENKLYTWIKQGVNTYNRLHKAKKHVSGFDYEELVNGADFDDRIDFIEGIDESVGYIPCEGEYRENMSIGDIMFYVGNNHNAMQRRYGRVGVIQVAGAAVLAAAAPILAALAGVLKSLGINTKKTQQASDDATDEIASKHNKHGEEGNTDEEGNVTHEDGTVTHVTNNADGTQSITVKHVPGTSDQEQENAVEGSEDGTTTKTKVKTKTKTVTTTGDEEEGGDGGPSGGGFLDTVKNFIGNHKTGVISTGAGVVALTIGLAIPKKRKGNALKYVMIAGGVVGLGFGGYKILKPQ